MINELKYNNLVDIYIDQILNCKDIAIIKIPNNNLSTGVFVRIYDEISDFKRLNGWTFQLYNGFMCEKTKDFKIYTLIKK